MRLAQYAVLGIGGVRALQALGIDPILVHLNEGHAALSGFERARLRANGGSFAGALADVKQHTVFTTHTPVPAGNEGYSANELDPVLGGFATRSASRAASSTTTVECRPATRTIR